MHYLQTFLIVVKMSLQGPMACLILSLTASFTVMWSFNTWDPKWVLKQFRNWSHLRSQCPKFSSGINVRRHFCSRTRAWWLVVSARRVGLLFQQYAYSLPICPFRRFRGKREKEKFQRAMWHSHGWKWIYLVELAIFYCVVGRHE